MKLSILICNLLNRDESYGKLIASLLEQIKDKMGEVQILIESDNGELSIGAKRNILLKRAEGQYLAFVDDDDTVSSNYVELLLEAVESGCDCASLKGEITMNGGKPEIFEHSLKYKEWKTNPEGSEIRYERYPNHLSLIKSSIAKQFKYPEKNHGEDFDWSKMLHESGLLKSEHYIDEIIYYYNYTSNK